MRQPAVDGPGLIAFHTRIDQVFLLSRKQRLHSPLAGGWLSGRYRNSEQAGPVSPARQRLANRFDLSLPENQRKLDAAEALAQLADKAGISLIELAIASRSCGTNFARAPASPRSMSRFRACWMAQDWTGRHMGHDQPA